MRVAIKAGGLLRPFLLCGRTPLRNGHRKSRQMSDSPSTWIQQRVASTGTQQFTSR